MLAASMKRVSRAVAGVIVLAVIVLIAGAGQALADTRISKTASPQEVKTACQKSLGNDPLELMTQCITDAHNEGVIKSEKALAMEKSLAAGLSGEFPTAVTNDGTKRVQKAIVDKQVKTNSWTWECQNPNSLTDMVSCFKEATTRVLGSSLTFWMSKKLSPQVAPAQDQQWSGAIASNGVGGTHWTKWRVSDVVWKLQQSTHTITVIVAAIGIVFGCVRVAWSHRAQPFLQLVQMFVTIAVVTGLAAVATQILIDWGDLFSPWIMEYAYGSSGLTGFKDAFVGSFAAIDQLAMALVLAPLIIIGGLAQIAFMIFRNGVIYILLGFLPVVAASTGFEAGRAWFKRICGWILAFILYKPVAAVIYAGGLMTMNLVGGIPAGTDKMTQQMLQVASGMMVLALALLCLPAMIRLIAPLAATGASNFFSAAGVAGAAATGAVAVASLGSLLGGAGALAGAGAKAPTGAAMTGPSGIGSAPLPSGGGGGSAEPPSGGSGGGAALPAAEKPALESGGARVLPPGGSDPGPPAVAGRRSRVLASSEGEAAVGAGAAAATVTGTAGRRALPSAMGSAGSAGTSSDAGEVSPPGEAASTGSSNGSTGATTTPVPRPADPPDPSPPVPGARPAVGGAAGQIQALGAVRDLKPEKMVEDE